MCRERADNNKNTHLLIDEEPMPPEPVVKVDRDLGLHLQLARLRDIGLRYALDKGFDAIWQLDTDILPLPDTLTKLVEANVDYIVPCIVHHNLDLISRVERDTITLDYTRNTSPSNPYRNRIPQYWRLGRTNLMKCYAEGSGISFIRRAVLEAGVDHCYEENKHLEKVTSEDVTFAEKAKAKGFQCWMHMGALVFHVFDKTTLERSAFASWGGYDKWLE
jgi:GT2 family glycosyltransferase